MGSHLSALHSDTASTMRRGAKLNLWKHWFWITLLTASVWFDHGRADGITRERERAPADISQDITEPEGKVVVSKSVSVSKVSVKVGDVSIARNYDHQHPPVLNPRASQPLDNLINQFLEQLRLTSSPSAQSEETQYQLAYGPEAGEDYYSDYLHPGDDYLNYLYEMYNSIGDDYYEETDGEEKVADNLNNLLEEFSRSKDPSGRPVDVEEEFSEQLFENGSLTATHLLIEEPQTASKDKLELGDKFFNASQQTSDKAETTSEDFSSSAKKLSPTSANSDVYIKIGIFITVTIAVLLVTGGLVFVMMKRKIKTVLETNLMTNEEPTKGHSQFVFQSRGIKGLATSTIQENFNNHFGKSSAYLYDDLHSLDNDSFLTSLETISEKDKFNWE